MTEVVDREVLLGGALRLLAESESISPEDAVKLWRSVALEYQRSLAETREELLDRTRRHTALQLKLSESKREYIALAAKHLELHHHIEEQARTAKGWRAYRRTLRIDGPEQP